MLVGGEAFPISLLEKWQANFDLYNAYGPSECTVCVSIHQCKKGQTRVPIGNPLPGIEYEIDDSGELKIRGRQLADGYLKNEPMTSLKFRDHIYATGDLVERDAEGNIYFIGRIDQQIKLRGLRIEIGDIESTAMKLECVTQTKVIVKEDLLLLFVETNLKSDDIKSFLETTLPDYMVPQKVIVLKKFPLNSQGKINVKELKESIDLKFTFDKDPGDLLQKLWKEILRIENITPDTHFFAEGGDSLQLLTLISRIFDKTNIMLDFRTIFAFPTFKQQLQNLREKLC